MLKFLNHAIKLINTERLFKDSHFFNEVNFLASSPKNFILVFVNINFEYVFRSIVWNTGIQQKRVGNISKIRNGYPKLEVSNLLIVGLVLNFDTSAVANEIEFFFFEFVNLLERHEFILFSQTSKVQIELSYHDSLSEIFNNGGFNRYLYLKYS